jgi:single-stranded DNA-binding protein
MSTITISGRLTKDAEVKETSAGTVTSFSVAEDFYTKEGGKQPRFWDVSYFGARGPKVAPHLTRGSSVSVVGEYGSREYNGKTYVQCRAYDVTLMGGKRDDSNGYGKSGAGNSARHTGSPDEDPIPF